MMNALKARTGFLTEDALREAVPSIFATGAHDTRSARYTYFPTIDIVRGMQREGFQPVAASQSSPRDVGRQGHAKHMIRFRRTQDIARIGANLAAGFTTSQIAEFPEVVLINSHDGSSAYQLMSGIFRLVCTNGLIAGNAVQDCKVRHSGKILDTVIEAAFLVARSFEYTMAAAAEMKTITLNPEEALILAEGAAEVRFDLAEGEKSPVPAEKFLAPRRMEDRQSDLWTTFNRIQENSIRGGLLGQPVGADGRRRNMRTREVKGIDQNVKLNRALWTMAEKMAALKK